VALKTNYKFEKMERDRLKAAKKQRRIEEKRLNQAKDNTSSDNHSFESDAAEENDD
jgi:hypothetical protein|tara:strand:- start:210 stop:377 length:168 start_codon:yes stop_codon:yes gene_type:complete